MMNSNDIDWNDVLKKKQEVLIPKSLNYFNKKSLL